MLGGGPGLLGSEVCDGFLCFLAPLVMVSGPFDSVSPSMDPFLGSCGIAPEQRGEDQRHDNSERRLIQKHLATRQATTLDLLFAKVIFQRACLLDLEVNLNLRRYFGGY